MPALTRQALETYRYLDGLRIEAMAHGDADLTIHAAHAALNAWERYERRKAKCDFCGEAFAPDYEPMESRTFGRLCNGCSLICEVW